MADTPTLTVLQKAAQTVNEAELAALTAINDALKALDTALEKVDGDLGLPANFPSNARRILNELRSNHQYRLTSELPNLMQTITGTPSL